MIVYKCMTSSIVVTYLCDPVCKSFIGYDIMADTAHECEPIRETSQDMRRQTRSIVIVRSSKFYLFSSTRHVIRSSLDLR